MAPQVPEEQFGKIVFEDFSGGIVLDTLNTNPNELIQCLNCDFPATGGFEKRKGSDVLNRTLPVVSVLGHNQVYIISMFELCTMNYQTEAITKYYIVIAVGPNKTNEDADAPDYHVYSLARSGGNLTVTGKTQLTSAILWKRGFPQWDIFQSRAFLVTGRLMWETDEWGDPLWGTDPGLTAAGDRKWTDGSVFREIGLEAPGGYGEGVNFYMRCVAGIAGTGSMSDGVYKVAMTYGRSTHFLCEGNPNFVMQNAAGAVITSLTLSGGTATQSIAMTINIHAATVDAQINRVHFYRTLAGGSTYYWVKTIAVVAGVNTTNLTITDTAALGINRTIQIDNYRPPRSVSLCHCVQRMFYATHYEIYYSKIDKPEQVPATNVIKLGQDDGSSRIKKIAVLRENWILVLKGDSTLIFDATNPSMAAARLISKQVGIGDAVDSFAIIGEGEYAIWMSQLGTIVMTDGTGVKDVTYDPANRKGGIFHDLTSQVDQSKLYEVKGIFNPMSLEYWVYVPYTNSKYRLWRYNILLGAWFKNVYQFIPTAFCQATDNQGRPKFLAAGTITGNYLGVDQSCAYVFQLDTNPSSLHQDILKPTSAEAGSNTYAAIPMTCITAWNDLGQADYDKAIDTIHMSWESDAVTSATLTAGYDYGRGTSAARTFTHTGRSGTYTLGEENLPGWDVVEGECDSAQYPMTYYGNSVSFKFYESSTAHVKVNKYIVWMTLGAVCPEKGV